MSNARFSKDWGLQSIRRGALGIVRLLLLALSLQIALPMVEGLAAAPLELANSFSADLSASLCHDAAAGQPTAPVGDASRASGHCLFCLPLVGDHATQTGELAIPVPQAEAAALLVVSHQRERPSSQYVLAHSRAPPRESSPA